MYPKYGLDYALVQIAKELSLASGLDIRWHHQIDSSYNQYGEKGYFIWQDPGFGVAEEAEERAKWVRNEKPNA